MKKRGLAVIYDPHNLLQFIWYYCAHGQNVEWDALCLPNGFKGEYMSKYCEKAGIFKRIYKSDTEYLNSSTKEQFKLFLKMFGYYITGQRKKMCKRIVNQFINVDDYDTIEVLTDGGIVSGAFVGLSDTKEVIILEDGTGDYVPRKYSNIIRNFFDFEEWKSFLLSVMKYATPNHKYPLSTTKKCIKYCSHINKMTYLRYKEINQLFDYDIANLDLLNCINSAVYGEIDPEIFDKTDVILFTACLGDFCYNPNEYIILGCNYISEKYASVLIKKHPRDDLKYDFDSATKVYNIDSNIPSEVFLPLLKNKRLLFFFPSSTMLYMNNTRCEIESIYFEDLFTQSQKETGNSIHPYPTKDKWQKMHEDFELEDIKYIILKSEC